jgi:hypothetical protein
MRKRKRRQQCAHNSQLAVKQCIAWACIATSSAAFHKCPRQLLGIFLIIKLQKKIVWEKSQDYSECFLKKQWISDIDRTCSLNMGCILSLGLF